MKCPYCKSELNKIGQACLETTAEHVECREPSLKDDFACSNPDCITHAAGVHWNEYGELYCKNYGLEDTIRYIDNNNAPFGSIQRRINVEVYKHDEDFTLLKLFGWTFKVEFEYKSNDDGEILKKLFKIQAITPDHILYIPGIRMFFYSVHKHFSHSKKIGGYYADFLYPQKRGFYKPEWWRYASVFFIRVLDFKNYLTWKNSK